MTLALLLPVLSPSAYAISTDKVASDFFEQYDKLSKKYSPELKHLFADSAKISTTVFGDGTETIFKITGTKLKEKLDDVLKYQQAENNYDQFSQVQTQKIDANTYKISAKRYDLDKCYEDTSFNMIIKQQPNQTFQIVQLDDSTIEFSKCTTPLKQDIPAKLQIAAIAANKELPKQIDRVTVLEKVEANQNTLIYHYKLDGSIDAGILTDEILMQYENFLTHSNCESALLKSELVLGVALKHMIYNSNNQLILTHTVNQAACDAYKK